VSAERAGSGFDPSLTQQELDALLQSSGVPVAFSDLNSNEPKNDATRSRFRQSTIEQFNLKLSDSIERMWELPPVILQSGGDYVDLLSEARDLFKMGYFYACVAMCGIVNERLVKDLLLDSLLVSVNGQTIPPNEKAVEQLERIEISTLIKFLNRMKIIPDDVRKAAISLIELRNLYAHAYAHTTGDDPRIDALKAIGFLQTMLNGTVSLLKNFEFRDGKLIRKIANS